MKAAIIGLGSKGWRSWAVDGYAAQEETHVGAVMKTKELSLVAVCDSDPDKVRAFRDWWTPSNGVVKNYVDEGGESPSLYTDYEIMMNEEDPEIVIVATPVETHAAITRNIVVWGSVEAVLLEKPIADTVQAAKDIVDRLEYLNVPLCVNHQRRCHTSWLNMDALIRDHGGAYSVTGFCNGEPLDTGIHMADLMNWLTPSAKKRYVSLYDADLGKYKPYLIFDLIAYCNEGVVMATENGGRIMYAAAGKWTERYRDLKETRWGGEITFPDIKGMDKHAQLRVYQELVKIAKKGKTSFHPCTGAEAVEALRICEEWMK